MGDLASRSLASVLFCPATRPERVVGLPGLGVDLGVVDLEDAVAESAKVEARALARDACASLAASDPSFAVVIRVNAPTSVFFEDDIALAVPPTVAAVMVPKVDRAEDVLHVRRTLDRHGLDHVGVIAGIETVAGVVSLERIAETGVPSAVYFGAEDYIADLGGERSAEGLEVLYPRSRVAMIARLHGMVALDQIVADYADDERFRTDAALGRRLGYAGKLCIHPRQVALAREAFTPSEEAVARANALIDAYTAAHSRGEGVITFEGAMVDQPMLISARAVLARAAGSASDTKSGSGDDQP